METLSRILDDIGLENLESELYIAALSFGTVPASILAKKLHIPRSTARYTCEQLVRKGLMIETKKANTKLFTAENPTILHSLLHEEERRFQKRRENVTEAVKQLQRIYNPQTTLPEVTFYEGTDGVQTLLDALVKKETDLYSFGAGDYFLSKQPELITRFRAKAKQKYKNIFVIRAPKYQSIHAGKDSKNFQTRYFSTIEELTVDIQITEDMLSIISIDDNAPIGVLIKHAEIVREFQKIFVELWKKSE